MKSGPEQIKTWFNRVRRVVVKVARGSDERENRWNPEDFQAEQMEMEFAQESVRDRAAKFGVNGSLRTSAPA